MALAGEEQEKPPPPMGFVIQEYVKSCIYNVFAQSDSRCWADLARQLGCFLKIGWGQLRDLARVDWHFRELSHGWLAAAAWLDTLYKKGLIDEAKVQRAASEVQHDSPGLEYVQQLTNEVTGWILDPEHHRSSEDLEELAYVYCRANAGFIEMPLVAPMEGLKKALSALTFDALNVASQLAERLAAAD
ncbi:unnamed protein product [Durusdinium trenchii]|uniref:Uncharacterized protein n=1 Tax=Durusdinium trenchii TaxID=1381693 RepID=A0ABP0PFC3_9DINO